MDNQWYVRIRGQILGPFSVEKLQEMGKRGEFSRAHEVSQDGLSWERASAHPEFFPVVVVPKATPPAAQPAPAASASGGAASPASGAGASPTALASSGPAAAPAASAPLAPSPQPQPPAWYYIRDGKPVGPIAETELRSLLDAGHLPLNTLVWNDKLPAWCPAKDAFEHLSQKTMFSFGGAPERGAENLPESLCHASMRIRPWTMFLTVMYWLTAFLLLISGVTLIAVGAQRVHTAPFVVGGLSSLIQAIVWAIYGLAMYNYTSSLKNFQFNRTAMAMQKSLNELYNYFLVKGVIYIIGLIFLGILLVTVLILLITYGQEPITPSLSVYIIP